MKEEELLVTARKMAEEKAREILEDISCDASIYDLEVIWYIEEVVKNINKYKNDY